MALITLYLSLVNNEQIEDSINYLNMYIPDVERTACTEERIEAVENMMDKFYLNDTIPSYSNLKGFLDVCILNIRPTLFNKYLDELCFSSILNSIIKSKLVCFTLVWLTNLIRSCLLKLINHYYCL